MSEKISYKFRELIKKEFLSSELNKFLTYRETDEFYSGAKILNCTISGRMPKTKEIEFNTFKENLFDLAESFLGDETFDLLEKILDVNFGMGVGDKYIPINAFDLKGNKISINHELGTVLLIDFWATWCKYCQDPMEENNNLAKEALNTDYFKSVKIIAVSCDEEEAKWKQHIKTKNWETIEHYNQPNILKTLNLVGIPKMIIVGKDGFIKFLGTPKNIELKETLINLTGENSLLLKKEIWDDEKNLNKKWNKEFNEEQKTAIINELDELKEKENIPKVDFVFFTKSLMDKSGKIYSKTDVFIQGEIKTCQVNNVEKCVNHLKEKYNFENIDNKLKIIEEQNEELKLDESF